MSRIPDTFIDDLLNRIDILDVVDSRVKLKKAGKDYQACCPFHKEKSPSFTVSQDKQFYYCFGCGATGTAISFLMNYEHLGFVEAIENLARTAGLEVPRERQESPEALRHKALYAALLKAQQHFAKQLESHPQRGGAVNYLRERGLTDTMMQQFGMGYAPPGWDNLLTRLGVSEQDRQTLMEAGLLSQNESGDKTYDRFRDRIMFPILDVRGRTIGFGGRVLQTEAAPAGGKKPGPKYLNSPETPVFHKGKELYGLYQALQARRSIDNLVVVEGYMDVISLAQFGVTNAVATLGTACGEDHLNLAFKYTSEVIFCFDGDNAGRRAARRALQNALPIMQDGRQIKFLFLPEGQDPDTLVRAVGAERFSEELAHAQPLEQFFFDALADGIDTRTMEGRARLSQLAAPQLAKLQSGIYRELMLNELVRRTGLSKDVVTELMQNKAIDLAPQTRQVVPEREPPIPLQTRPSQTRPAATTPSALDIPDDAHDSIPPPSEFADTGGTETAPIPLKKASRVELSPAKLATCLLLEDPALLPSLDDASLPDSDDMDIQRLSQLIDYIRSAPQASFHTILGYWFGRYGQAAQQALADLASKRFLDAVRKTQRFDAAQELSNALKTLRSAHQKADSKAELARLAGQASLTAEQKARMLELLQQQANAKRH